MKRRLEEDEERVEDSIRRRKMVNEKEMRLKSVGHAGQRSGVTTTVMASSSASGHLGKASSSSNLRLSHLVSRLRALARNIQMGKALSSQLIDLALEKFVVPVHKDDKGDWEVEAEIVVTVLYVALTSPSCLRTQARDMVRLFTDRWIEGKILTLEEMTTSLREEWKCSGTALIILLCANLSPEEWNITLLKDDFLSWPDRWFNTTLPEWLKEATSCVGKLSNLLSLLSISAMVLCNASVPSTSEHSYVGSMSIFLRGSKLYKDGKYEECLDALQNISLPHCASDLQGWVYWLKGLCLAKVNSRYAALLQLQKAVDKSAYCLPAIYNVSQIFFTMSKPKAEVEALSLLKQRVIDQESVSAMSLQNAIISIHHNPDKGITHRVLFLFALHCVMAKKYEEASKHFTSLIKQLKVVSEPVSERRSLLREEDQVPSLPETKTILIMAAMTYVYSGDFNNALKTLEGRLQDTDTDVNELLYERNDEGKLMCLIAAAGCLVRVEALFKLNCISEALEECSKLEHGTVWISGIERHMWDQGMLKMRTLLYKTLSTLHAARHDTQSQQYYNRRSTQCFSGLRSDHSPTWNEHLSVAHKMVTVVILDYYTMKLRDT